MCCSWPRGSLLFSSVDVMNNRLWTMAQWLVVDMPRSKI
jgi:hypothetical protein